MMSFESLRMVFYSHSVVTMTVSGIISEIKRDIGRNRDFLNITPCIQQSRSGGPRRNIAIKCRKEKLEWCGYPVVKKFPNIFTPFDTIHERDGHQTHTARQHRPRLYIASRGKKNPLHLSQILSTLS